MMVRMMVPTMTNSMDRFFTLTDEEGNSFIGNWGKSTAY